MIFSNRIAKYLKAVLFFVCCFHISFAQTLLNGDFEINTAGFDQINLVNSAYNSFMPNSFAFGDWGGGGAGGGDMDIITSSNYCGSGAQNGNWYVALTSGGTDAISMTLSAPLVAGNTYSMTFYDRSCSPHSPGSPVEIGVSTVNNAFGTQVYSAPTPTHDGGWILRSFSFIAPISSIYITVRCGGPNSGAPWTQVDNFRIIDTCSGTLSIGNDTALCAGQNLLLNATTTGATYLWQDGSTNSTFNVTQQGLYWAQVSVNSCVYRDSVNVAFNAAGVDFGNDTTLCPNENLILIATTPGATYLWQDGSTNSSFSVTQAGTYQVSITAGGCSSSDTINVAYEPGHAVNIGNDTTLCQGENLQLNAAAITAAYLWQDGSADSTFIVTQPGNYWVNVTINGCTFSDSILINYNNIPTVNLGNDTSLCAGATLQLNASAPAANYLWQDGSTYSEFTVTQAGNYWVNVTASGCSNSDTIDVAYISATSVSLGNDTTLCPNEILQLDATTPGATYLWHDGSTNSSFSATQDGSYWVDVTIAGCNIADTINVSFNLPFSVNLGNDTMMCEGETLLLNAATLGATYLWQNGSTDSLFAITQTGTYYVNVTVSGCSNFDSIDIAYNPLPVVNIGNDTVLCAGEILLLDAAATGATYLWQDGSTNSSFTVTQNGIYRVIVEANDCIASDSINVSYASDIAFNFSSDTSVCENSNLVLNATTTGATYLWQDGSTVPTYSVTNEGLYSVTVNGICNSVSDSIRIDFLNCDCELFFPSAFSPNKDGFNDAFKPLVSCNLSSFEMKIFNRWGNLIFETTSANIGWDGTYKGEEAPIETYVFVVTYTSATNSSRVKNSGNVTLIR